MNVQDFILGTHEIQLQCKVSFKTNLPGFHFIKVEIKLNGKSIQEFTINQDYTKLNEIKENTQAWVVSQACIIL